MKNIKKKAGTVAAVGLISFLSLGGLSSAAFAGELSHTDPQTHKQSMVVDGGISVVNHNDINNDGLVNAGDTFDLNLHVENTSDNDYNHVDVSSFGLGLNRAFVSDSLPAGDSVDYAITYEIKESDTLADTVSHNVFVNVRDETRIENSTSIKFSENIDMNEDVVVMSNSKLTGLIMDKVSGNVIVSSIDEYDNYYGIDESRLTEGYHTISVGDGYVYAFDFTNETEEAITLDSIQYVDNIIEENISGTVVEPGETANLYAISEITRDDLDWGLINSKATVGGSFDVVVSDTNGVNYSISNGKTTNRTTPAHLINWGDSNVKDIGGKAESNIAYKFIAEPNATTVVVDGINSERFGFIESSHVLETEDEITVEAPETIVLESGDSFTENAFAVYRGKYHSEGLTLNSMEITGSYSSDTGGGLGDETPDPSLTIPVCGEEAQPVLPSLDEFNEGRDPAMGLVEWLVEREDNVYNIYVVDYAYPMIMDEHQLEIPEVVPCPVEVPDYEEPTFVPGTCDTDYVLNIPENTEHYRYSSSRVYAEGVPTAVFGVRVYNAETDEQLDSWSFEYVLPVDCDPVVPEVPEIPVPEVPETPDVPVVEVPEVPVKEEVVPPTTPVKPTVKVESGEVSERSEVSVENNNDDSNVAVFALIAGIGALIALAAGGVLVRSRKK